MNVTAEERETLVYEVADRLMDCAYAEAHEKADQMLRSALPTIPEYASDEDNEIRFAFSVSMTMGDVRQIIGRERRFQEGCHYRPKPRRSWWRRAWYVCGGAR